MNHVLFAAGLALLIAGVAAAVAGTFAYAQSDYNLIEGQLDPALDPGHEKAARYTRWGHRLRKAATRLMVSGFLLMVGGLLTGGGPS